MQPCWLQVLILYHKVIFFCTKKTEKGNNRKTHEYQKPAQFPSTKIAQIEDEEGGGGLEEDVLPLSGGRHRGHVLLGGGEYSHRDQHVQAGSHARGPDLRYKKKETL